jgi:hypothetical protein
MSDDLHITTPETAHERLRNVYAFKFGVGSDGGIIPVIVQQLRAVFDAAGRDYTVYRVSDRDAFRAERPKDVRSGKKRFAGHLEKEEVPQDGFKPRALRIGPDALKDFREDDSAKCDILALLDK